MSTSVTFDDEVKVYGYGGTHAAIPCTRSLVVAGQGYFPSLVAFPDGEMVSVLRGGDSHVGPKGRLDLVRSLDGGLSWSDPVTVFDSDADDRNPALGIAADGSLVLLYGECRTYNSNGEYYMDGIGWRFVSAYSTARGATWSEPALVPDPAGEHLVSPFGGGPILTCPDGRLIASVGVATRGDECSRAGIAVSDDHGRNWSVPFMPFHDATEEIAFEALPDGRLIAAIRAPWIDNRCHGMWSSFSSDDGATWTHPRNVTFDQLHPGHLLWLNDEVLMLTYGCRRWPFGVRALISRDGGESWDADHAILVVDDVEGSKVFADAGYPSTVLLPDGYLFTIYYRTEADGTDFKGLESTVIAAGVRYRLADLLEAIV